MEGVEKSIEFDRTLDRPQEQLSAQCTSSGDRDFESKLG